MLDRSNYWLDRLLKAMPMYNRSMVRGVKLAHSKKADRMNSKSARAFCYVIVGEKVIHCSKAIEALPDEFIVGILLHELAHMIVDEGFDPELDVDEWVLENVPEAGYKYADISYRDIGNWLRTNRPRTAKNLECVSGKFLKRIG